MIRQDPPEHRKIDRTPTPNDLADAPELAILAALDQTLDLVVRALVCAYPELADPECPGWLRQASRLAAAAETLVEHTTDMQQALRAYREAVEIRRQDRASEHPDDLPF
ncbi:MAG: hypothetical protein E4H11_09675 [Myxococcales bacterium]|nr:MAG: hypothetical protein E4H11_09675 [Myxococcales bacterium]